MSDEEHLTIGEPIQRRGEPARRRGQRFAEVETDDCGLCVECGTEPAEHTRVGCPASALLVPDWD